MLTELSTLHDEIERFIAELEALTGEEVPRLDVVATARLKLTRVSRRRTTLLETAIYPRLLESASAADLSKVEALRSSGKQSLIASGAHIGRWTLSEIGAHWRDYCAASHALRVSMRERIEQERNIIYPLLTGRSDLAA